MISEPIWGDVKGILANKNSSGSTLLLDNGNEIPTSLIFLTNGSIQPPIGSIV